MSIRTFFEQTLPLVLQSTPASLEGAHRSFSILIEGFGAWTIELGGGDASVRAGDDAFADLTLVATTESFAALLHGEVQRTLLIDGDRSLLDRLINLLSPPASNVVQLRAARETKTVQRKKKRW